LKGKKSSIRLRGGYGFPRGLDQHDLRDE